MSTGIGTFPKRSGPVKRGKRVPLKERDVVKACLDLARHTGWEPIRLQAGVVRGPKAGWITLGKRGRPDWLMIRAANPGYMDGFYLEFKKADEKPGSHQLIAHEQLRNRGFLVAVIDSTESFLEWMQDNFGAQR